jgi:hypothetical protein
VLRLIDERERTSAPAGGEVTIAENVRVHAPADGEMWLEARGMPSPVFFRVPCRADAQELVRHAPVDSLWCLLLVPT